MSQTHANSPFPASDQAFDDRAKHLQKNIYGSEKGKLRLAILQRDLAAVITDSEITGTKPQRILDVGCGAGLMSEWALTRGHQVQACDNSAVMLAEMQRRLGERANLKYAHTALQNLVIEQPFDIVMCHAVLEWVEDKARFFDKLAESVKGKGYLSLMFYNAWAREFAQLVYGNFDYVDKGFQVKQRVKLSPHWPCEPDVVESELQQRGLMVQVRSGIRIFYDILRDKAHYQQYPEAIIRHELRLSQAYPHWQMGRYVHLLAVKNP